MNIPDHLTRAVFLRARIAFLATVLLLGLSCAVAQPGTLPSLLPGQTEQNFPRMDGSASTETISYLLTSRVLGLEGEWRRLPPSRHMAQSLSFSFPIHTEAAHMGRFQQFVLRSPHHGTPQSYAALIAGSSDVLLVARPPSQGEISAAKLKDVTFDVRPLALDAFVFLVNRANPVESLTLEQLRDLFGGKVKLWRTVGGRDFPVKLFGREQGAATRELLDALVMKGQKPAPASQLTTLTRMGETIQRVGENPNAISYSVFYYEQMLTPNPLTKLVAVGGVRPSVETIGNGRYPLTTPVFVVTRAGGPPQSAAVRLRDWLLGAEGQKLISGAGYIPLQVTNP